MPPMKTAFQRLSLLILALALLAVSGLQLGCRQDKGPEQSPYQVFN